MLGLYSGTEPCEMLRSSQMKHFIPEVPEMKQRVRNSWSIRTNRPDSMNPGAFAYQTSRSRRELSRIAQGNPEQSEGAALGSQPLKT